MFPEEGILTIMGSIIIGICFGLANRYLIGLILSAILALLVESYAVNHHFWYKFGDNLFKHLLIGVCVFSTMFILLRLIAMLLKTTGVAAPKSGSAPIGSRKTASIAHALGLLNFFPFAGSIVLAFYWFFNRASDQIKIEQIKEAFQFQALYMVTWIVFFVFIMFISVPNILVGVSSLILLSAWLIMTITAVVLSACKGAFHYPVKLRLFDR